MNQIELDTKEYTFNNPPSHEKIGYSIEGRKILYRGGFLKGADPESFIFYAGDFAKDNNFCYCQDSRLRGANPKEFRAQNYTYYRDNQSVWVLGSRIVGADIDTFQVCDDGRMKIDAGLGSSFGFAKDKNKVYFFDGIGKAKIVKADPDTFLSFNNGLYGADKDNIFCGHAKLVGAKKDNWERLTGFYSKDHNKVFYFNRRVKDVDLESFKTYSVRYFYLAKDNKNYYRNDSIISKEKFEEYMNK